MAIPPTTTAPGEQAAAEALAPLAHREGPRIGVLGDSGTGKTFAMARLIQLYTRKSPGIVLVVDDKEARPQFEGQLRRDVDDLRRRPLDPQGPRVVVFRGDRFARGTGEVNPERVAEIQWKLAQLGKPSLVVYDELDKAANYGQWREGDESAIRWSFTRGRSSGAASLWGTQMTAAVPAAAFDQSSVIWTFRMQGAPLRLLDKRGYLIESDDGRDPGEVIKRLPGDERPREERGLFVALRRGRPWDGKVYRFGTPPATKRPASLPMQGPQERGAKNADPAAAPNGGTDAMRREG